MLTLGVETSCDETSIAVVENGRWVRANVVASQIARHREFGGVVPEIASREHVKALVPVMRAALSEAKVALPEVDAVAATYGPGLAGALLTGVNFGQSLAVGLQVPYYAVNHLEGHIHSVWLTRESVPPNPPSLPLLALIVSGGHTELVLMRDHGDYTVMGRTLDDAAGEAFDKVARLLGLEYPGGPSIERAARAASSPTPLPRAWLPGTYDFSFSGLKTAVLHAVRRTAGLGAVSTRPGHGEISPQLTEEQRNNLAAGFQESVIDVLVKKTALAAGAQKVASVAIVGGVAANTALAQRARETLDRPLYIAEREFSTDNAAMIAAASYFVPDRSRDVDVRPQLELVESSAPSST